MEILNNTLITSESVYYPSLIKDVKIHDPLQPFWELLTNALEAIADDPDKVGNGSITIRFYYHGTLFEGKTFNYFEMEDTGVGFNDTEFERFLRYKDDRKGHNNKGSGRLQVVAAFNTAEYESTFKAGGKYFDRKFHLSGRPVYQQQNGIVFHEYTKESTSQQTRTFIRLLGIKPKKVSEAIDIDLNNLKERIITHYISYLCANRQALPLIRLQGIIKDEVFQDLTIQPEDVPALDKEAPMPVSYESYDQKRRSFLKREHNEIFTIKAFRIPAARLAENAIYLTSKGQIVDNDKQRPALNVLAANDKIDSERFLFLISGSYIDSHDQDNRGEISIQRKDEFLKDLVQDEEEHIFLDEVERQVNDSIVQLYEEIQQKNEEKASKVEELKSMFLLNDEFLSKITISVNDSEEKVLEKVYALESKQMAKGDAKIKKQVDELKQLDPSKENYQSDMKHLVDNLVKEIPHRNRAALTHYVAKRKLVLDIYDQVLNNQLDVQSGPGRKKNERLLHNILFQQKSNDPLSSDLWIISEDYIYFKGTSEAKLMDLTIGGQKIFREVLTEEEKAFVNKYNINKLDRRTDVLLFPQEGKCIILEFKAPDVNVGDHLTRINNYASLILNFTKPEYHIDTFYGYLIGELVDPDEVRASDNDFKFAPHFDFLYRPHKSVFAKFKPKDGDMYMEVIKYSTLWQRAKKRNEVFIDILFKGINAEDSSQE